MSLETILPMLRQEPILVELAPIQQIMTEAMAQQVILEIHLDRDPKIYSAMILGPTVDRRSASLDLWISPMEPPAGNLTIRHAQKIRLHFFLDCFALETVVDFVGISAAEGGQGIRLSYPRLLRILPRRNDSRLSPPKNRTIGVIISRRKGNVVEGRLMDINMVGLGFICPPLTEGFAKNEMLRVQVLSQDFGVSDFEIVGTVCYSNRFREADACGLKERYGLRFLDHGSLFSLKILMKRLRKLAG